ncbi:alpha-1,6-glucosidase domain-containing protein [Aquabacterium sp.]|uniref:alpha-1,6-glucosidase domain-containing protein n=1 Tax=Aquabacterium sp. TaxID=1872578 RepID=UPI0037843BA0
MTCKVRVHLAALLLLLLGQAGIAAAAAAADDCNDPAFATVLRPTPALPGASARQAVWLDARRLRWPGAAGEPGSRFVLLHAAEGGLQPRLGQPLPQGADTVPLQPATDATPPALAQRYRHVPAGLELVLGRSLAPRLPGLLPRLLRGQLLLARLDGRDRVQGFTPIQHAGALDALYAAAAEPQPLGVQPTRAGTRFGLWAPTARQVALCLYPDGHSPASRQLAMQRDARSGRWSATLPADLSGRSYRYQVDVFVPGVGLVRNRVTDPYAVSLNTDSQRSLVADLAAPTLKPPGWDRHAAPATVQHHTDLAIYELHVRDFSISDDSVPEAYRGKYAAFTQADSRGMRRLAALARAGLTDVHLLPVFDFASVPEAGCRTPAVPDAPPDSPQQQAAVMALAAQDCFNWGYDPLHYGAPEGSYATDAEDGTRRIIEFRQMVQALHRIGLRVGMDLVYNHTHAAGQQASAVLDRIVPGYYQRLDAAGAVERSTCCDNTATEHRMMARLMIDTVLRWAGAYRIDSFRFDLMGHQPRDVMLALQRRLRAATGRDIALIGEGWNFGEVANGARFVQASQLALNGSGIATFSDRARDALRGRGGLHEQGWLNGLVYDRHPQAPAERGRADLLHATDLVRVGMAGSLRRFRMTGADGRTLPLERVPYGDQPAGYVAEPGEVVNYVENHDNATLFDDNAGKLPPATSREDRARVQMLGAAVVALSQGIAYFHAGQDILRSKSMDANSFDSGDWFNRLDWSYQDNHFGSGLPPERDNGAQWPALRPLLADAAIKPGPAEIAWSRDAFRDLLRIRASSRLFRLPTAQAIVQRLHFHNTGPDQEPTVIVGQLDGRGLPDAGFDEIVYLVNADKQAHQLDLAALRGCGFRLHPVQAAPDAADRRPAAQARYDPASGRFSVPPRSVVVWVR